MKRTRYALSVAFALSALGCTRPAATPRAEPVQSTPAPSAAGTPLAIAASSPGPLSMTPRRRPPELVPREPEFTPFGRVIRMDQRRTIWGSPPDHRASVSPLPQHYETWHERRRTAMGYGYLSILDLSVDDRFLLVVSEEEARIHTYDFASLRPIAQLSVDGYAKFGRGDFAMWPFAPGSSNPRDPTGQPSVVFAGPSGLVLVNTGTALTAPLSAEPAHTLRWTDDHLVLGATISAIPEQRSRIAFYGAENPSRLEPLLVLDFAERVEEWDLDSAKRRLAVTYYPSNQVEVLDLAQRQLLWSAAVPEYTSSLDISADDRRLAVGGSSAVLFDLNDGRRVAADDHFGNNIHKVRFSPSGDALAVSSYEGKIRIFDVTGPGPGLPLRKLLRHTGTANVYAIAFNRDGSELVSGSGDQTVRVWGN